MPTDDAIARRLRLRDLYMLRVVTEVGSMARAAEVLALSQPAISKAITEMERVLGAPLFDRSARGVEATAYGRVLVARATAMLDELRQGIEEIRFLADPTTGEVRIGATEPMTAIVSVVISQLLRRYPRMMFRVEVGDTAALFRWLRERAIDLAVTRTAGGDAEADLRADTLFQDPLVVMTGRQNPLVRRRGALELAELLDQPWTLSPPGNFLGRMVVEAFRARGLQIPPRAVIATSVQARVALMRTGRFLSVLPAAMLRFPEQYPGLSALPVDLSDTRRAIAIVTLANRTPAPAALVFAECARSVAQGSAGSG
jgi:DNA-binding transcriptional LysR family regulator